MIKILIKTFVKDYNNTSDIKVREAYGTLAGIIGIICNMILFSTKLTIGFLMNSIAISSDAFNNLSDIGSSMVALIGAKLSGKDPDFEHPYGHGRFEYIASLIISFIIMLVGIELLKSSFDKVLNPEPITFNPILIAILVLSILIKVWMFSYNRYIGHKIDSGVNRATAADSLNDVIATSAVVLTTLIGQVFELYLDGYAGVVVSLLIIYAGFQIAKDTVNVLLGMSPSEEVVEAINTIIKGNSNIVGVHDLKVHDYGPGRTVASVHAELSDQTNLVKAHSIIDGLEKKIFKELGIDIVIHVDPIGENEVGPID